MISCSQGCVERALQDIAINRIGAIAIGLAIVELFGVLCACFMARSIRYQYETV